MGVVALAVALALPGLEWARVDAPQWVGCAVLGLAGLLFLGALWLLVAPRSNFLTRLLSRWRASRHRHTCRKRVPLALTALADELAAVERQLEERRTATFSDAFQAHLVVLFACGVKWEAALLSNLPEATADLHGEGVTDEDWDDLLHNVREWQQQLRDHAGR